MMRSLNSAVAGLRSHQTKMDVIGNNIANVNTYGFKSSRATFSDVYYQTLSSGRTPNPVQLGGTNPTQIGYGASVATIDVLNTQSSPTSTDRALDVFISGDGFIATKDASGNMRFSRLGILGFDADGYLVDANGQYVLGFPQDADGNPIVNPDGSCHVDDLTQIQIDPKDLDGLMDIAISSSGEIVGTLEGDAAISLNKNKPSWLEDITIKEDSYLTGNIKVIMQRLSETNGTLNASWVSDISSPANSGIDGDYTFTYTDGRITARNNATGESYTGTYKKGSTIDLTDASGNVGFTLVTDAYADPSNGNMGVVSFTETQYITVEGTDKGGNLVTQTEEYTGSTTMTMLGGDVTLTINPDNVGNKTVTSFSYNFNTINGTIFGEWLNGATISEDSTMSLADVNIWAGIEYVPGVSLSSTLGFLTDSVISTMVKELAEAESYTGTVKIAGRDTGSGIIYEILDKDDNVLAASNTITSEGQAINFYGQTTNTSAMSWLNAGTYTNMRYTVDETDMKSNDLDYNPANVSSLLAAIGEYGSYSLNFNNVTGVYTLTTAGGTIFQSQAVTNPNDPIVFNGTTNDGTGGLGSLTGSFTIGNHQTTTTFPITLGTATVNPNVTSGTSIANVKTQQKIYLVDAASDSILADATYSGSNTVKLGDITLSVNPTELKAYFDGALDDPSTGNPWGAPPVISSNASPRNYEFRLGTINRTEEEDWDYNNNAATASTGVGESFIIGQIAIAKVPNPAAMKQVGDSYFALSFNSGELASGNDTEGKVSFWKPGLSGTGELVAGYLEMSNVDISKEFTDMITTQRGFQANTRIITVSDEMLQELVNLKR